MSRLAPCRCGHPGLGCDCYEERRAEAEQSVTAMTAWCNWEHCPVIGRHRITIGVGCRASAASGADQPTLRDQLAEELAHWPIGSGYYATSVPNADAREMADALLPLIEADRERAKAEGGAEALEQAADELDTRAVELWRAYKSGPPTDPRRASQHTEGESDGWENAATHVRARAASLRATAGQPPDGGDVR